VELWALIERELRDDLACPFSDTFPHRVLLAPVDHVFDRVTFDAVFALANASELVVAFLPFMDDYSPQTIVVDEGDFDRYVEAVHTPEHVLLPRDWIVYVMREARTRLRDRASCRPRRWAALILRAHVRASSRADA
jgi:hypothetical protein